MLHDVEIKRGSGGKVYVIDGVEYNVKDAAKRCNKSYNSIVAMRYRCNYKQQERKIQAWLWLEEQGLHALTTIFRNGDTIYSVHDIMTRARVKRRAAVTRGTKWQNGTITTEALFKRRRALKYKPRATPLRVYKSSRPRRNIDDLPKVGTWEAENLNPKFVSPGRHCGGTARDHSGKSYTGSFPDVV